MEPFTTVSAIGLPVDIANCDTDQIIPARFLKRRRSHPDFPRYLFHDLRFDADGNERPGFIYNQAPFRDAGILVADINWGCGSSREDAVYALVANGIRAVIAPQIGDIHYGNCLQNGVLPVRLPRADCDALRRQLHAAPGARVRVDLVAQEVTTPDGTTHGFEISAFDRTRMLEGLDGIEVVLREEARIAEFEAGHWRHYGWLFDARDA